MKVHLIIICSIILCAFYGCSSNTNKQLFDNNISIIDYSEFAQEIMPPSKTIKDNVHFIKLKMEDKQSLLKSFDKIAIYDQELYVLDTYTRKLVVFDWNGNPLKILNRKGRGPGEYLSIEDFCIDPRKHIFITDTRTSKVIEYDVGFNFVKSWNIPYVSNQIVSLPNGNFLINLLPVNKGKYANVELLVVDSNFNDVKCVLKYDAPVSLNEVISLPRISCSKYGICYHRTVNDNVYILQSDGDLKEIISFNFGSLSVPEKHRENLEHNLNHYTNYVTLEECYAVADNKIYGVLFDKSQEYMFVLNKSTNILQKKKYECSPDRIGCTEYPIGTSDNYFITYAPYSVKYSNQDLKETEIDDYSVLCLYEI